MTLRELRARVRGADARAFEDRRARAAFRELQREHPLDWDDALIRLSTHGGPPAVPWVVTVSGCREEMLRIFAAEAMGCSPEPAFRRRLRELAFDRRELVRAYACTNLGEIGTRADVRFLLDRLEETRSGIVKAHAAGALRRLGVDRLPVVLGLLGSRRYHVRCTALRTLIGFLSPGTAGPIAAAVDRVAPRPVAVAEALSELRRAARKAGV